MAPAKVFGMCADELREAGLDVPEILDLAPHEKDHAAIVVKKK